jgi:antitoxin component YwqK of YwqJK toxin-antitoxin module
MKYKNKFVLKVTKALLFFIISNGFLLTSCDVQRNSENTAKKGNSLSDVWTDTIIKLSYEDGKPLEVWGYKTNKDTTVHYEWKFYRNGNKWVEGSVANNVRHGQWFAYNVDGVKISMAIYNMGKSEGLRTVWHDNGQKYYEGEMKNDERIGIWKFYNQSGKLVKEIDYTK